MPNPAPDRISICRRLSGNVPSAAAAFEEPDCGCACLPEIVSLFMTILISNRTVTVAATLNDTTFADHQLT